MRGGSGDARTGHAPERNEAAGRAGKLPAHDRPPPRLVDAVRRFLAPYEEAFWRAHQSPGFTGAVLRYIFSSFPASGAHRSQVFFVGSPPACRAALSWKDWRLAAVYVMAFMLCIAVIMPVVVVVVIGALFALIWLNEVL